MKQRQDGQSKLVVMLFRPSGELLKGRWKFIININRCKVGKGVGGVCNNSALRLSTLPQARSGAGVGRVSGAGKEARGRQVEAEEDSMGPVE